MTRCLACLNGPPPEQHEGYTPAPDRPLACNPRRRARAFARASWSLVRDGNERVRGTSTVIAWRPALLQLTRRCTSGVRVLNPPLKKMQRRTTERNGKMELSHFQNDGGSDHKTAPGPNDLDSQRYCSPSPIGMGRRRGRSQRAVQRQVQVASSHLYQNKDPPTFGHDGDRLT